MVQSLINAQDQVNVVVNAVVVANVVVRDVVVRAIAFCADKAAASQGLRLWSKRRAGLMHRAYLMHTSPMTTTSIPTPGTPPAGQRCWFEGSSSCAQGSTGLIDSRLVLLAS